MNASQNANHHAGSSDRTTQTSTTAGTSPSRKKLRPPDVLQRPGPGTDKPSPWSTVLEAPLEVSDKQNAVNANLLAHPVGCDGGATEGERRESSSLLRTRQRVGEAAMKRLIVVADNSLIVGAIRTGLRDSGAFQLLGYIDARNASAGIVRDARADVVLVDEADHSEQVITLIRNIKDANDDITLILLMVRMEGEWLRRALRAGASGAISKAVHPVALATLVREVLSGHIVHAPASITAEHEPRTALAAEHAALTGREREILQLVAFGATNGEIARRLWITQQTVKFHVSNIYRKLDVANRTEACHYAHVNDLVAPREAVRIGFIAPPDRPPVARRERPRRTGGQSDPGVDEGRLDVHAHTRTAAD